MTMLLPISSSALTSLTSPPRLNLRAILSPSYLTPRMCWTWAMRTTVLPSISTMTSPTLSPAFSAGEPLAMVPISGQHAVDVLAFHGDAEDALLQVLALLEAGQDGKHVFHRDGETDAGIVPFGAGCFIVARGGGGDEDALDAPLDIDDRAAVIDRRNLGVGLDRLAPDAAQSADDADRNRRGLVHLHVQGAAQGDGHLPFVDILLRHIRRHRQVLGIDLEQRQHARLVGRHARAPPTARRLAGEAHQDRRRIVEKIVRAGDDVAAGIDNDAGGRARTPCAAPAPSAQRRPCRLRRASRSAPRMRRPFWRRPLVIFSSWSFRSSSARTPDAKTPIARNARKQARRNMRESLFNV